MTHNPYSPPQAQDLQAPPAASGEVVYAGFWRRIGSYFIDALILSPVTGISVLLSLQSRLAPLYMFVPASLLTLFFNLYLVQRYGGTPGRLLLKTRITLADGSPVTLKAAALRYSVMFVLTTATSIALLMGTSAMSDELYFSLSYLERSRKTAELVPSWHTPVNILLQIWFWSEFITMYFNEKRQALLDLMAGTVVVRTK